MNLSEKSRVFQSANDRRYTLLSDKQNHVRNERDTLSEKVVFLLFTFAEFNKPGRQNDLSRLKHCKRVESKPCTVRI